MWLNVPDKYDDYFPGAWILYDLYKRITLCISLYTI